MNLRRTYLALCVVGTLLPWSQFLPFFADNGLDLPLFLDESFPNRVASGAAWDLIVSSVVLWVFVLTEGRRRGVPHLWAPLVANVTVGVSLGLPLFLYLRQRRIEDTGSQRVGGARSVVRIRPQERTPGDPTAGMVREEAFSTEGMWAGLVRTESGMTSGWHHHGDNETTIYVASGALKLEFGTGVSDVVEAGPGDFVLIPPATVHRESNPANEESHLVVVRSGTGPPTINVDGPRGA